MCFLSHVGDGQQSRWGLAGRLTSTQPPSPLSAPLWAHRPAQGHSTAGQDVTLPYCSRMGQDSGKPPSFLCFVGRVSFSRKAPSGGERHWEIILHLVILPSHIWRKREIKQHRVGTHSILRAAEIGIITILPEPPWD